MKILHVMYSEFNKKGYFFRADMWDYDQYMEVVAKDVYVRQKFNSLGFIKDSPSFYFNDPEEELLFLLEFGSMVSSEVVHI